MCRQTRRENSYGVYLLQAMIAPSHPTALFVIGMAGSNVYRCKSRRWTGAYLEGGGGWGGQESTRRSRRTRPPAHYAHVMLVGDHEEQPKPGLDTGQQQQQNDQQTWDDERRGDILQRIRRRLITIEYIFQFLGPLNGSLCWGKAREGIGIKRKRIKSSWKE